MPSNISREKRRIEQESRWFYEDLTAVLKHDTDGTLARFNDMVAELKSEPSLSRETVMARFDECMREYPRFCKRVIGIRPDGTFLLVDMERSKAKIQMAIPATPPDELHAGWFAVHCRASSVPHAWAFGENMQVDERAHLRRKRWKCSGSVP